MNGISWNNDVAIQSENSIGLVVGEGAVYGLMDPEIWDNETFIVAPDQREGHAMVYDVNNHVTVLFGGVDSGVRDSDTWAITENIAELDSK